VLEPKKGLYDIFILLQEGGKMEVAVSKKGKKAMKGKGEGKTVTGKDEVEVLRGQVGMEGSRSGGGGRGWCQLQRLGLMYCLRYQIEVLQNAAQSHPHVCGEFE